MKNEWTQFHRLVSRGMEPHEAASRISRIYWDDQQVNISGVRLPAANAPTWAAFKGSEILQFSGSQNNAVHFTAQLTHRYVEGTDLEFHIHYVPEDNTAGNHRWQLTHSWSAINGTFPTETTVTTVLATPEATDKHTIGEIAATIDGSSLGISSLALCSLTRTGSHADDTYNGKVIRLLALDFHVQMDAPGSRRERAK